MKKELRNLLKSRAERQRWKNERKDKTIGRSVWDLPNWDQFGMPV